ncbi:MAG: hypothetical protein BWY64_01130 [bacterium ADurb.Bin363]|nr:MAG: hypothetical protein BWY64_01130 [bacterium ADurb.Bin363]
MLAGKGEDTEGSSVPGVDSDVVSVLSGEEIAGVTVCSAEEVIEVTVSTTEGVFSAVTGEGVMEDETGSFGWIGNVPGKRLGIAGIVAFSTGATLLLPGVTRAISRDDFKEI